MKGAAGRSPEGQDWVPLPRPRGESPAPSAKRSAPQRGGADHSPRARRFRPSGRGFRSRGGASGRRGRVEPGNGGCGAGSDGRAMAANLSRNGPALQEAYVRVVTEKSPTDWWAPRRAGAGGGPGWENQGPRRRATAGGPGSPVCPTPAPHPGTCCPRPCHPVLR